MAVLVAVARQKTAQPGARVAAASVILDRGWGKVKEHVENGEGDIKVTIRHILEHVDERPVIVNGEAVRCIDVDTTTESDDQPLPR
jgi:pyruvoyl-dependent arginine decarboxylase (PvlArgDC)